MPRFDLIGNPLPDNPASDVAPRAEAPFARAATPRRDVPATNPFPAPETPPVPQMVEEAPVLDSTRLDLSGNPLPVLPSVHGASSPGAEGVWPPPPSGADPNRMSGPNDSGQKANYPPEVAAFNWNWGPWFWSWLWCFAMKMPAYGAAYLGLIVLSFVPFAGFITGPLSLALTIYLCLGGHKLAWQNRRFADGFEQYLAVQRAWLKWGIGFLVVGLLLIPILAAILFPVFARARMKARMQNGYYTQPNGGGSSAPAPSSGQ